jgi:gliding motility-associated lipoprotein GldD
MKPYHFSIKYIYGLAIIGLLFFLPGCREAAVSNPKPRGYPRVFYPERGFEQYKNKDCPYTFEYPAYATIEKDTSFLGEKNVNPCWFDMSFPGFNSKVYCSYYPVGGEYSFDKLREDAFELAYKHSIKANAIEEIPFRNKNGLGGFTFNLEGPVASSFMFYLTDTTDHFIRGSLYFNTQTRPDSLAPVFNFLREDLLHFMNSFEWTE